MGYIKISTQFQNREKWEVTTNNRPFVSVPLHGAGSHGGEPRSDG